MSHKNITLRAPVELIDAIDRMAREESQRSGLPVSQSAIIRRAVERDLERHKQEMAPQPRVRGGK